LGRAAGWRPAVQVPGLLRRLKERERDEGLSVSLKRARAVFIEPMLLLRKEHLPEGPEWMYEIKLDG